jgi:hypothetical protein
MYTNTGKVFERPQQMNFYEDRIDYKITKEQYDGIIKELEEDKYRFFNYLFRNCTTFATDIAHKAGLDVSTSIAMTPNKLSKYIQRIEKQYQKTQTEFKLADHKIEEMFSENKIVPTPERKKGHPVTLINRLKSGNGIIL